VPLLLLAQLKANDGLNLSPKIHQLVLSFYEFLRQLIIGCYESSYFFLFFVGFGKYSLILLNFLYLFMKLPLQLSAISFQILKMMIS